MVIDELVFGVEALFAFFYLTYVLTGPILTFILMLCQVGLIFESLFTYLAFVNLFFNVFLICESSNDRFS